jgi:hypothetical protein
MHMHTHIPVLLDKKTESVRVIQMGITVHIQVVVTLHGQTVTTATSRMDQILHSNDPPPPGQITGVRQILHQANICLPQPEQNP